MGDHPVTSEREAITSTRLACAGLLAVVTPLGFATKLYSGPGAGWVAAYAGGFFYVLFWIFLLLLLVPTLNAASVATFVFIGTSLLEILQLWQTPALAGIRSSFVGHALLGSTFSWGDFLYYGLGALAAPGIARRTRSWVSARRNA